MRVGIARSYRLVCFAGRALAGVAFAGITFAGTAFADVAPLQTAGTGAEGHPPTACRFEGVSSGRVRAVADGRSFVLDDGREIRLAGIEVPVLPAAGETGEQAEAGRQARAALESMLAGRDVELRHTGGADRYGRIMAQAYVRLEDSGPYRSATNHMLAMGFARVSAQVGEKTGDRPCADEMLAQEHAARESKLGLWRKPYYAIRGAESVAELNAERGHFTVVEGKVQSVRESGGTIYMNFGRRWSQALTVTVLKRNERMFAAAGLEPKMLENRRVRVRGWIEERNGPRIDASRAEQIEIAERN
jgi:endonuclease YncB( thermonuclease family)